MKKGQPKNAERLLPRRKRYRIYFVKLIPLSRFKHEKGEHLSIARAQKERLMERYRWL